MFSSIYRDSHFLKSGKEITEDQAWDLIIREAEILKPDKITPSMLNLD